MSRDSVAEQLAEAIASTGLSLGEILEAARAAKPSPTVAELGPRVEKAARPGARSTYWNALERYHRDTPDNQVTPPTSGWSSKATIEEVEAVVAHLTRESHPLAGGERRSRRKQQPRWRA